MIKQTIENFGGGHGGGGHGGGGHGGGGHGGGGHGGGGYHDGNVYHHDGNVYHHYGHHDRRYRNRGNRDYPYFYGYYNNYYYCDKDKIILNDTDVCYNRIKNEIDNCNLKSCNIEKYEHKYEKKCEKKFKCSLVGIC